MSDESSGSDFDDDEDPDKIQVPGGGKDLATAVGIANVKEQKSAKISHNDTSTGREVDGMEVSRQIFAGKSSSGMILENSSINYSMIQQVNASQGIPGNFVTSSQKNTVGDEVRPASSSFPLSVALSSVSSLNASAFSRNKVDINNSMGNFIAMGEMNRNINPFLQLLNQSNINSNWISGLCGTEEK